MERSYPSEERNKRMSPKKRPSENRLLPQPGESEPKRAATGLNAEETASKTAEEIIRTERAAIRAKIEKIEAEQAALLTERFNMEMLMVELIAEKTMITMEKKNVRYMENEDVRAVVCRVNEFFSETLWAESGQGAKYDEVRAKSRVTENECAKCGLTRPNVHEYWAKECPMSQLPLTASPCEVCGKGLHSASLCLQETTSNAPRRTRMDQQENGL